MALKSICTFSIQIYGVWPTCIEFVYQRDCASLTIMYGWDCVYQSHFCSFLFLMLVALFFRVLFHFISICILFISYRATTIRQILFLFSKCNILSALSNRMAYWYRAKYYCYIVYKQHNQRCWKHFDIVDADSLLAKQNDEWTEQHDSKY